MLFSGFLESSGTPMLVVVVNYIMGSIGGESVSVVVRASSAARKQRDGPEFVGGYGQKTGSSDLLFIEGQLPTVDGRVIGDAPADAQLRECLSNLEQVLAAHGRTLDALLKVTLYLTTLDDYDAVNAAYRDGFDCDLPPRTVVGVSELLGNAAVQLDAIAAIE